MTDTRKELKLWLEPDDHKRLQEKAKLNKRSMRSEVYYYILQGIRHDDEAQAAHAFATQIPMSAIRRPGVNRYDLGNDDGEN